MPKCSGRTQKGKQCSFTATCGCYCKKHNKKEDVCEMNIKYHNHFVFEECTSNCPLFWTRGLCSALNG